MTECDDFGKPAANNTMEEITMRDFTQLLWQMTVEEKIGQLTQYNANLFVKSQAEITGPLANLGLSQDDLKTVGSVLNFTSAEEACQIQKKHFL